MARRRRHRSARRHHNPISIRRALSNPVAVIKPAVVGAAGALAVNAIVNYAPLPDTLKTGNALMLTKAGLAILIGTFGPKLPFVGRHAAKMAEGALTVQMTDLGKQLAGSYGYNLSGMGFVSPAQIMYRKGAAPGNVRQLSAYVGPNRGVQGMSGVRGMGMYVKGRR